MQITREVLAERLAALTAQRDQLNADLNACIGAVQDTQFWLNYFEAPDLLPAADQPDHELAKHDNGAEENPAA